MTSVHRAGGTTAYRSDPKLSGRWRVFPLSEDDLTASPAVTSSTSSTTTPAKANRLHRYNAAMPLRLRLRAIGASRVALGGIHWLSDKEQTMSRQFCRTRPFLLSLAGAFTLAAAGTGLAAEVTHSVEHTFSVDDVQGGFDGSVFAEDPTIICGLPVDGSPSCPLGGPQPEPDKTGIMLYPVNSEFGFIVSDFVGAATKSRDDGVWGEGWVGDIYENNQIVGLRVSNVPTDTFKVKSNMGTWCAGLGGTSIKCSTEHYSVLEHVKTCFETIPYLYADPATGEQGPLTNPATGEVIGTCAEGKLDNTLRKVVGGIPGDPLEPGEILPANESTVRDQIAVGPDYGLTFKDDGKALYRFGNLVKRPNDVRIYAKLPLPQEWKDNPETDFPVLEARLIVEHLITNNPNDQLRPEDMENEGATGRIPKYLAIGEYRYSVGECYEGDGDYLPEGTYLKTPVRGEGQDADPAYSADLVEGFTNAWYTTIQRDPFEPDPVSGIGPRWRLRANKFGQDIPGLEIPLIECSPVPFTSENIKYEVGEPTVTTINLLDWKSSDTIPESPLLSSRGWIDAAQNLQNLAPDGNPAAPNGISINGLPLTPDFDLAVYIKGDQKPTSIFKARLEIVYEGEGGGVEPPATAFDMAVTEFKVPSKVKYGDVRKIDATVANYGPAIASGVLNIVGTLDGVTIETQSFVFGPMAPGESEKTTFSWLVDNPGGTVNWTATLIADGDTNTANNSYTASTVIR